MVKPLLFDPALLYITMHCYNPSYFDAKTKHTLQGCGKGKNTAHFPCYPWQSPMSEGPWLQMAGRLLELAHVKNLLNT